MTQVVPMAHTGNGRSADASLRVFKLQIGKTEISVPLRSDGGSRVWDVADRLVREHRASNSTQDADTKEMTSFARLLAYVERHASANPDDADALHFLRAAHDAFCESQLGGNDVHAAVSRQGLTSDERLEVVSAHYACEHLLNTPAPRALPTRASGDERQRPALLRAAARTEVRLCAMFGGQGNDSYFGELAEVYNTYAFAREYVDAMSSHLAAEATTSAAAAAGFFREGLDVTRWLRNPSQLPSSDYLLSAPVSFPLIGLTQLAHYWVAMGTARISPAEFASLLSHTAGHSQGIVACLVASSAKTSEDFFLLSRVALLTLLWMAVRAQQAYPLTSLAPAVLQDSLAHSEGEPTPMLSVRNMPAEEVARHVAQTNKHLVEERRMEVALVNGPGSVVIAGHPQSLHALCVSLRRLRARDGESQDRVPHSRRRQSFSTRYLPVTVPFHSRYMAAVPAEVMRDVARAGLAWTHPLQVPVHSTFDGSDLATLPPGEALTAEVIRLVCTAPVHWERTLAPVKATHILDFGPGGAVGIGSLTHRNIEGTGVHVVLAGVLASPRPELLDKAALFSSDVADVQFAPNWGAAFAPRLVRVRTTGAVHVETRMSKLLGRPPIMVAGMTPSTVSDKFVAAVTNAGFHIELAGGGHHTERALRDRIRRVVEQTKPGDGVNLNMLYLNARQWGFQFPLVQQLRREGVPVDGICVAAGVPSPDAAREIVAALREAGVRHISFKPGSTEAIRQVLDIAREHPDVPILLQWTGGRAGGHHSYEDFHQPILDTYGLIRKYDNVVLVAGSGFGDGAGSFPYITGEWSERYGRPRMPFDGILLGSRVMVAQECATSPSVKRYIAECTPGIEHESQWEETYEGIAGGVTTVVSELGEPIHKVATRGVLLWKRLDKEIFSLAADKQLDALVRSKDWIIAALNADYQKVYFGRRSADGSVCDLPEMSYADVALRLVELTYVADQKRWIDPSFRTLAFDFVSRIEERFAASGGVAVLRSASELDNNCDPTARVREVLAAYPAASEQLLTTEDVRFFLALCKRPGQKPVPFVPAIDADFKTYFKKDSLWQAEDIDAVVGRDPGRVCILQGPVAARHSRIADEPVADILGGIYSHYIDALRKERHAGGDSTIPVVEYLGGWTPSTRQRASLPVGIRVEAVERVSGSGIANDAAVSELRYVLPETGSLPTESDWFELLGGSEPSWLRALLTSPAVVQGRSIAPNPLRRVLRPRHGQKVIVRRDMKAGSRPSSLEVYDSALGDVGVPAEMRSVPVTSPSVEIRLSDATGETVGISVALNEMKGGVAIPLVLRFEFAPGAGHAPIREVMEGRTEMVRAFYSRLWLDEPLSRASATDYTVPGSLRATHVITRRGLVDFCQAVGNRGERHVDRSAVVGGAQAPPVEAPLDYAIVAGWRAIIRSLFHANLGGDILRLVHLSNTFEVVSARSPALRDGDIVETTGEITAVENQASGRLVDVRGVLTRGGRPFVVVTSQFLLRGTFDDYAHTFRRTVESPRRVVLAGPEAVAVLRAKDWVKWMPAADTLVVPGAALVFELSTEVRHKGPGVFDSVAVDGRVVAHSASKEAIQVGAVCYRSGRDANARGNPVLAFLERAGAKAEEVVPFPDGARPVLSTDAPSPSVQSPPTNEHYAAASLDVNPIHVNPYFAAYAGLPGTITHGMWTSAAVRRLVEVHAGDNDASRVSLYSVRFVGMVLPNDRLSVSLSHVGMRAGRKVIRVEARNQDGATVLEGSAEIEQPRTAYVFTGQGAQEVGMGMDLYDSSEVARSVWDRAERHFLETYGFSILRVVRANPVEMTVHFGGTTGRRIRQNYMSMVFDACEADGTVASRSLFPDIRASTLSYTFRHPQGLLSATQFTQPAIVLFEKAAYEDMRARGLVQDGCVFAGHSLGEYAALAALGDVLPIESLVDVCFYRGMTMQCAVPRDDAGRSRYGMVAVNPTRAGLQALGHASALQYVCAAIAEYRGALLEIVNHNVEGWQYVVAGELGCLDTLAGTLNAVRAELTAGQKAPTSATGLMDELARIVKAASAATDRRAATAPGGVLQLERGVATIPLPGIDVPFHSRFLLSGVPLFRQYLRRRLDPKNIDPGLLRNRYVPNLTAEPFEISRGYFERVRAMTDSESIAAALSAWPGDAGQDGTGASAEEQQRLAYVLLVELLAYQFASPVRWIETQDRMFRDFDVERVIEIGPQPTLSQMAIRTLKLKYEAYDEATTRRRAVLCFSKDRDQLYFESTGAPAEVEQVAVPTPAPVSAVAAPAVTVTPMPAGPATSVPDAPVTALDVVQVLVAVKARRKVAAVPATTTIKEVAAGKSTLQNEIVGDLAKEFGAIAVERPEEMPLGQLAAAIQPRFNGRLGKQTSALVSRLFGAKMPAGFTAARAREHLRSQRGLGEGRADGVLLLAVGEEPDARLSSEADALAWLDRVADSYGSRNGITVPRPGAAAVGMPAMFAAAMGVPAQAEPVADVRVPPLDFLRVLLAVKLKRPLSAIAPSQTIKALVAGKSALQNELVGDIQLEFGTAVDSAAEMTLDQLAQAVGGSYAGLGKCARAMIARTIAAKMPAGVTLSVLRQQMASRGLGEGRQDAILLRAVASEPAQRLASEAEASAWLDGVISAYATEVGVKIGASGGAAGGAVAGSVAMGVGMVSDALTGRHSELLREQVALFRAYLGDDTFADSRATSKAHDDLRETRAELDTWLAEHGEDYGNGVRSVFDSAKIRRYDSYFNWSRQEVVALEGEVACAPAGAELPSTLVARLSRRARHIANRATPAVADMLEHRARVAEKRAGDDARWAAVAKWCAWLAAEIRSSLDKPPVFRSHLKPTRPVVRIGADGRITLDEETRPGCETTREYAKEMKRGAAVSKVKKGKPVAGAPFLCLRTPTTGEASDALTQRYFRALADVCVGGRGVSFRGKTVLVTGCGRGSIAGEVLRALLEGGADVIATTSSFSRETTEYYRRMYEECGARGSSLVVLPFNQGSRRDVEALIRFVYEGDGLASDVDIVIPFAAISEGGRPLGSIDSRSELAHRIMLTNVLRLLGEIRNAKEARGYMSRPALAVLPLSPNHGLFGSDGLYAESKIGLETLFRKWHSEDWAQYLSVAGAVIGWTRGTGLMSANDTVAPGIEDLGVRTFSTAEMALNIVALLHPSIVTLSQEAPVWADFGGGFDRVDKFNERITALRRDLAGRSSVRAAVAKDVAVDEAVVAGQSASAAAAAEGPRPVERRANMCFRYPNLPSREEMEALTGGRLRGMLDLERVVVIVGYGEVGPWGSARTRWEMERSGEFSLEGCVEMAWIMGFIRHHTGPLSSGGDARMPYAGWVDAATGLPVRDAEIKERYEQRILSHAGIRIVEPSVVGGFDPDRKQFMRQVAITKDMPPIEASAEEAATFKREHGDKAEVFERPDGTWAVVLRKGATLYVPRALKFDRYVAGQLPTGWDATRYGVPADIAAQVDPVTLFNLVSTAEALVSAGISDPYELYRYVHVSEVGNTTGGGMGGLRSLKGIFRDRHLENPIAGDTLQEVFINTMAAWVNMLLLSASGPIKTPVGACATAVESVELGVETILSGKARVVICGGFDDIREESMTEFASMGATSSAESEAAHGREPSEMSRPTASSRSGFMESQGSGNQILMSAALAIEMGVPIYGIVALTNTAMDKEGRSVPAPGRGILTTARERKTAFPSPLLSIDYRRRQLESQRAHVAEWRDAEMAVLRDEASALVASGEIAAEDAEAFVAERAVSVQQEARRQEKAAMALWGNEFYARDPSIAPIRGALGVYGLTVDDIAVASFHGTSTKANDINESQVLNAQMAHLGRTRGNPVIAVCQKYLTGHPKGAAAAWMLNGVLQAMEDGVVPGNRNADNIDAALAACEHVVYPSRAIRVPLIKAALLKSFGFGQVGGEVLVVHPAFLFSAIEADTFAAYADRRRSRQLKTYRHMHDAMAGVGGLVRVKDRPPYTDENEQKVYLDPLARAEHDQRTGGYAFRGRAVPTASEEAVSRAERLKAAVTEAAISQASAPTRGVGVDIEPVESFASDNATFVERNFTSAETAHCLAQADPRASFAGRWCAKEAVIKAISSASQSQSRLWTGPAAGLCEIEVLPSATGAPSVFLHGAAADVARRAGVSSVRVSITHAGEYAMAVAVAQ